MAALRAACTVVLCVAIGAWVASCSSVPVRPSKSASLRVIAEPETASVYVNDQFVGSGRLLALRPKAMRPGVKFITFQAPNYFPHDVRLELPAGETTVRIKLRPIPP